MSGDVGPQARVMLYGRKSCHLCDVAREVVMAQCAAAGVEWDEIDVDTDPALAREHGEYVPVVTVDGIRQGFWRIDGARLRAAIGRGTGGSLQ